MQYIDNSFNFTLSISPIEVENEVERLFKSNDTEQRDAFVNSLKVFISKYPHYYWLILVVFYKSQALYYASQNDDLEEFQMGFLLKDENLDFSPKERFTLFYNKERVSSDYFISPKDYKWSINEEEEETSFIELVMSQMRFSIQDFSGQDYEKINAKFDELRNAATSYLWFSLQKFTLSHVDEEELAACLWTVFDTSAHDIEMFKADGNVGQDAVDFILQHILYIDKEAFNVEENLNNLEDLKSYGSYVHDYIKIAQEVLDMDIFDM